MKEKKVLISPHGAKCERIALELTKMSKILLLYIYVAEQETRASTSKLLDQTNNIKIFNNTFEIQKGTQSILDVHFVYKSTMQLYSPNECCIQRILKRGIELAKVVPNIHFSAEGSDLDDALTQKVIRFPL